MKNALFMLLLLTCLPAKADDSKNTITAHLLGLVLESACTIAPESVNQVIDLNGSDGATDIYNSDLERRGNTSPWVRFDLRLINCPFVTTKVTASFTGNPDGVYYRNNGDAENVAIELQSTSGEVLSNGTSKTVNVDTASRSATFNLQTHAVATAAATSGSMETVIQILFNYE